MNLNRHVKGTMQWKLASWYKSTEQIWNFANIWSLELGKKGLKHSKNGPLSMRSYRWRFWWHAWWFTCGHVLPVFQASCRYSKRPTNVPVTSSRTPDLEQPGLVAQTMPPITMPTARERTAKKWSRCMLEWKPPLSRAMWQSLEKWPAEKHSVKKLKIKK